MRHSGSHNQDLLEHEKLMDVDLAALGDCLKHQRYLRYNVAVLPCGIADVLQQCMNSSVLLPFCWIMLFPFVLFFLMTDH